MNTWTSNLRIFRLYGTMLTKRPVLTQICSGTALVVIGDAAAQHWVEEASWRTHDWSRTGNMMLLRGMAHSTMIIYWYRLLHAKLPMHNSARYTRLATYLALDQGLFGPFSIFFFFVGSGVLEGKTPLQIKQKLDHRLLQTITSGWLIWVPFSFIAFRFIPIEHRLLTGQGLGVAWNCFMSFQNHRTA